ncbi:MAG: MFS transporter [Dehalococcoidia bacterium]|nr:MFS transporter [Dehalococcoidia bacterium]
MVDEETQTRVNTGIYYVSKFTAQVAQNLLLAALFVAAGTQSSAAIGISGLFLASLAPGLVLGFAGGALADRIGPARGYALGAVLRLLPVVVGIGILRDGTTAALVALLFGVGSQVFAPAEMALVSVLQRQSVSRAHSLVLALQYGGQGVGVLVLAPALYFLGGTELMMIVTAGALLVVTVLSFELARRLGAIGGVGRRDPFCFASTCRFFLRHPHARIAVTTLGVKTAVARGVIVALPFYLSHDLGIGSEGLAFLVVPGAAGAILGLGAGLKKMSTHSAAALMRRSLAGMLVALFAFAVFDYGVRAVIELSGVRPIVELEASMNTTYIVALPAAFLLGLSLSLAVVASRVALTGTAPQGQQARVFAGAELLTESLLVLPLLLTGVGTEVAGARVTLAAIGGAGVAVVIACEAPLVLARFSAMRSSLTLAES